VIGKNYRSATAIETNSAPDMGNPIDNISAQPIIALIGPRTGLRSVKMEYPGKNELRISGDATKQLLEKHFQELMPGVRITGIEFTSYLTGDVTIEFTSDPAPVKTDAGQTE
jgi:hypothetical protein